MPELDLLLRAPRAVVDGVEGTHSVAVTEGRIVAVEHIDARLTAREVVDLGPDEVLLPGLVDTHVHVNEPGRTHWEGFASATRAAAAGGVTTIVDMPLNSVPPTVDVASLEAKRRAARGRVFVDVGFWGGAVPGNRGDLLALHDAGVFGFKCFLVDSGVVEFPPLDLVQLAEVLDTLRIVDALTIVHAEDAGRVAAASQPAGRSYRAFLDSRPDEAETVAVQALADLSRRTGARAHVLHVSSARVLPVLRRARRDGTRLTAETCPHYLALAADDVPDGATQFKCCPPIRDDANRDLLWQGLGDGTISCVVSDHSPCTADLKLLEDGDFDHAWGGIASLQLGLSVVWSEARRRGLAVADVVRWMSAAPADLAGLTNRKGRIAVGADADLCVLAPDETFVVDPERLHHRNLVTPYAGTELRGVVRRTWLRGREVGDEPTGELLAAR
ncbi:MAG: allantoinase AllB [Actinomycetes bacterium]